MRSILLLCFFSLAALIYFFNEWSKQPSVKKDNKPQVEQPEYTAEKLNIKLFDVSGVPTTELRADKMEYYLSKQTAHFERGHYLLYNQSSQANWQLTANKSQLSQQRLLILQNGVELTALTPAPWINNFTTEKLFINLNDKSISTHSDIVATGDKVNLTATGINGNLNKQIFTLDKNIHATIDAE